MNCDYIIGIDFSLNSPAVCINDGNELKFESFFNTEGAEWDREKKPIKRFTNHNGIKSFVEMHPYERTKKSELGYVDEQRVKITEAEMIAKIIVDYLPKGNVKIALEGFSYNSDGASYIDLVMFNSILRAYIADSYGVGSLYVIPPAENKKFASGKGNANKELMIKSMYDNRSNDEKLIGNKFYDYLINSEIDYKNVKPIDDLVDAYWLERFVECNF